MLRIFSQEDFALRSKLWPNNLHCFCVILESPWLSFFQLSFSSSLASFLGMALAVGFEKVERKFYQKEFSFSIS